jgi:hypothetical protein
MWSARRSIRSASIGLDAKSVVGRLAYPQVGVPADLLIYTGSFFPPMHMGTPANFSCRQALVHGICGFF